MNFDARGVELLKEMGYRLKPNVSSDPNCEGFGASGVKICTTGCYVFGLLMNQLQDGGVGRERVKSGIANRLELCGILEKIES